MSYNPNPLNIIYLDRDQCNAFETNYFEGGELHVPADVLLRSKDYDRHHVDLLSPLGSVYIHIIRNESDAPGWYRFAGGENPGESPA